MVRNRMARRKKRNPGRYFLVFIAAILLFGTVNSGRSLLRIVQLTRMKKAEREALGTAVAKRDSLRGEIVRLTSDTLYIEEIARRDYGMIRPGEEVYNITLPDTTGGAENNARKK